MQLEDAFSSVAKKKETTIGDFIERGSYAIMRKCPGAYKAMGHNSMWEMKVTQFHWLINNLNDEFTEEPDKNKKNKRR
ncbi:MAG: hypothetical protein ACTSYA_09355 [Candidatus Kariarchaeaceae archaeon]